MKVIKYLWQLPQNLLGLTYILYNLFIGLPVVKIHSTEDYSVYTKSSPGSVTLGRYIFLSPHAGRDTVIHETGHVTQSLILGPLYLLVIGLPSILWAAAHRVIVLEKDYYWFYTENWANKLAGIDNV